MFATTEDVAKECKWDGQERSNRKQAAILMLQYMTLRLQYITLRYVTLRYITLHYVTLRYITLRYITIHYITYYVRATGHLFVCLDHITLRITLHTLHTLHTL